MCGRFSQYSPLETLQTHFNINAIADDCEQTPDYNIAPGSQILGVINADGNRLERFLWGFFSFPSPGLGTRKKSHTQKYINARAETLAEKPAFKAAFKNQRCLIPADGFYEWQRKAGAKLPWYFTLPSGEPFAFAGIFSRSGEKGERTCAIITTESHGIVKEIHHRMPVILMPEAYALWLNPEIQNTDELKTVLQDYIVRELSGYRVSSRVNSVKNNDCGCIKSETLI